MQTTQTYTCSHCGERFDQTFNLFLHCFIDHLHQDIALSVEKSKALLIGSSRLVYEPFLAGTRN